MDDEITNDLEFMADIVTLLIYIIGGSILLISFVLFLLTTFWIREKEEK